MPLRLATSRVVCYLPLAHEEMSRRRLRQLSGGFLFWFLKCGAHFV